MIYLRQLTDGIAQGSNSAIITAPPLYVELLDDLVEGS